MRIILIGIFLLLVVAAPARAQAVLDHAADTLKLDPVYVDPEADRAPSDDEAEDLRAQIEEDDAGPLYIAVLPASAAREAGGSAESALAELARSVDEPGVYATVIGDRFRAGATEGILPRGRAGGLAREAIDSKRADGTAAVLSDFVRRVGAADRGTAGDGDDERGAGGDGGGGFPWLLLAIVAVPVALIAWLGRRRRLRDEAAEFAKVRDLARGDVIRLGDEIRALDLDIEMPDVDPEAKEHYGLAVERYQGAEQALEGARRPEDLQPVVGAARGGALGDGGDPRADGGHRRAGAARAVLLRPAPRALGGGRRVGAARRRAAAGARLRR